ncbi:TIR domain-containing protein [Dyella sp. C11]|uniref:TIR domain-containing protein n=1 Tax=Dyella sp. C11 TaxID=2126991 RepID=UPI000D642DBE|nr:TIR domain-containing protein [Dyella sp. C11]
MSISTPPKVFVSHASEDKDRFVLPFAAALRGKGIDAWVDRWEMLPGDSLVDKIFEEGLKEAAAVIIVLSKISVVKPWVREELNAAVVDRIGRGTKLIPVVLDDCEVPQALKSLVWEPVKDPANFNESLARVVDSVFGHTRKPALGPVPAYVNEHPAYPSIRGLTSADAAVLYMLFEHFVRDHFGNYQEPGALNTLASGQGIESSVAQESLEVLANQHLVEILRHLGPGPYPSRITELGVSKVLGPKEGALVREVALAIQNNGLHTGADIAASIGLDRALVEHAIKKLQGAGHINVSRGLGGETVIFQVNATLKRSLG